MPGKPSQIHVPDDITSREAQCALVARICHAAGVTMYLAPETAECIGEVVERWNAIRNAGQEMREILKGEILERTERAEKRLREIRRRIRQQSADQTRRERRREQDETHREKAGRQRTDVVFRQPVPPMGDRTQGRGAGLAQAAIPHTHAAEVGKLYLVELVARTKSHIHATTMFSAVEIAAQSLPSNIVNAKVEELDEIF